MSIAALFFVSALVAPIPALDAPPSPPCDVLATNKEAHALYLGEKTDVCTAVIRTCLDKGLPKLDTLPNAVLAKEYKLYVTYAKALSEQTQPSDLATAVSIVNCVESHGGAPLVEQDWRTQRDKIATSRPLSGIAPTTDGHCDRGRWLPGPPPAPEPPALLLRCSAPASAATPDPSEHRVHATGGSPPYSWRAAELPDGVQLDASTGTLAGRPPQRLVFTARLTATDQRGAEATIECPNLAIAGVKPPRPRRELRKGWLVGSGVSLAAGGLLLIAGPLLWTIPQRRIEAVDYASFDERHRLLDARSAGIALVPIGAAALLTGIGLLVWRAHLERHGGTETPRTTRLRPAGLGLHLDF